ncbi:hypothetical protein POM88_048897 [Heracleum sosnowskyi]|uniref:Uncharacterized protein n=2 Tax=Magnoliopsida TaxID=3398 RepID=A0AAD8GW10_9APIA|nr:hypothetical protein POM88_048897 [Heracleum sosnowskyi]
MIPYPFGINSSCSINPNFVVTCNETTDSPKAFLMGGNVQVYDISNFQLRISNSVAYSCYNQLGTTIVNVSSSVHLGCTSYMYSDDNEFTVVGCDDFGKLYNNQSSLPKGCSTTCENIDEVPINGACAGSGCCQVPINLLKNFTIVLDSYNKHRDVSIFNNCGYAFLGERDSFVFQGKSDLNDSTFWNRTMDNVPIVLDWVIGNNNCAEAALGKNSSVCSHNSTCVEGTRYRGYLCKCYEGYEGNPYLEPGCQVAHISMNVNKNMVVNNSAKTPMGIIVAIADGGTTSTLLMIKNALLKAPSPKLSSLHWRKHFQLREKFFEQNGGLLLRQQSISEGGSVESTKHFTYEELKKATNNYAADRIVGQGGYGIVYKGILPNQRIVAVKRSKVIDGGLSWLSLDNRLRIAAESSGALAYLLHSAASMPIMHRDVKLANILLDDNCVSKISDFGASRLVPMDQTKVVTLVQGTLGFGVVPAELLTGRKPICMENSLEEKNLATYFITSLKENKLFQVLDRRVVKEGAMDQLEKAAQLVKRCLNLNGEERPTMKEVMMEIESLRKLSKHPWANQHANVMWAGQALFGTLTPDIIVLTLLYSIAGLGIAIVNDFKSVEGDRAMGLQSLPVAFGFETAKWICVGAIDVTQLSVAGYLLGAGKPYYALALLGLIAPQVFFQFKYFLKDPVKYDVKYQASAQPFLILGLLVTALATSH